MKCSILLTIALIAFVAGDDDDGAWERNKEYKYRLVGRTLKPSPQSKNEYIGVVSQAYLLIRPQSDDLLIGQITQAEYGKVNGTLSEDWIFDLHNRKLENWPLNKPFNIHLQNGVIRSLSVDNSLTDYEVNQMKVIVSQLQVDTKGQNLIAFNENQLPVEGDNSAIFKTMEPLVTGNCETVYEISPVPEYLIKSHPEWVPMPELRGAGEFLEIVKSRSYSNCHETSGYLLNSAGHKDLYTNADVSEERRIFISGSLKKYTIQSSVTVNKVINGRGLATIDYVNVTLESVLDTKNRSHVQFENLRNLKNIGNLVYRYESDVNGSPIKVKSQPELLVTSSTSDGIAGGNDNDHDIWSTCWTAFPAASTLCKSEFGAEFVDVDTRHCGFLGLGKEALCRLTYPGCVATPCYSAFYARSELCEKSFGDKFPITQGGFEDCSPGFYRSRCCPKLE